MNKTQTAVVLRRAIRWRSIFLEDLLAGDLEARIWASEFGVEGLTQIIQRQEEDRAKLQQLFDEAEAIVKRAPQITLRKRQ